MKARQPRKLAVILHADVVGSTALVQRDETLAHERIQNAFERLSASIAAYGGTTREVRGDALVAEFDRASDAVCAALAFQAENARWNAALDDGIEPQLRIGLGMGEVVIADRTVTGAGVVLAQRLEQLAAPGGVCIQGAAYETVPQRLPFAFASLGEQRVKGFEEPVRSFSVTLEPGAALPAPEPRAHRRSPWIAVAAVGCLVVVGSLLAWLAPWETREGSPPVAPAGQPASERPSIAVLPFVNMSDDAEQAYFVDGITEDLITDLSKLHGLRIVAHQSTLAYRGRSPDLREVAQALDARYVLEGSVRKASGRVRITAQLVDTGSGVHLWAERYDRELKDIFAVQDEVTRKIVAALSVTLSDQEEARLSRASASSFEAYDLFLRGQQSSRVLTKDSNVLAQDMYRRAIELDPTFARAHGALAVSLAVDFRRGWAANPDATLARALELARKAVALDDSSPEVRWALGYVSLFRRQYERATEALEDAIRLAPNYADAYGLLALIKNQLGRPEAEEAVRLIRKAMALNPNYTFDYPYNLGRAFYTLGRYTEAVEALQEAIERNEAALVPHLFLAASYVRLGQQDDAEWEIAQIEVLDPEYSVSKYASMSRMRAAEQLNGLLADLRQAGLPE